MAEAITVGFERLVASLAAVLAAAGCSAEIAAMLAANCAGSERDGNLGHGLFRMPGYVSTLRCGWADGRAEPVLEDAAPGFVRVDARNGFAQPALRRAAQLGSAKARACGVSVIAIRNSHHLAALAPDVEPFAQDGLLALSFVNSMGVVVPHGGRRGALGTNPVAFAVPRAGQAPIVVDFATAAMSHGEVSLAAREGRPLPEGVGVDSAGEPTTDAAPSCVAARCCRSAARKARRSR